MARLTCVLASLAVCSTSAGKAPLPDVDAVLTKATSKAHDFAEQAAAMRRRLDEQQEKSRAALFAQKMDFEQRLDSMEQQSKNISIQNSELQAYNRDIEQQNSQLFAAVKLLQANNSQMRDTLQNLTEKISAAQLFVVDSLKVTDDSQAEELKFLAPTTPKPTLDYFLEVTSGRKVSLLAMGAKLQDYPTELVGTLSNSLTEISAAQEEGAAELKAQFLASMAEKQERQAKLNATQAELFRTKADLQTRHGKLVAAKAHLEATGKQLRDRLSGMRVFADKLDGAVASTLGREDAGANASSTPQSTSANSAPQSTRGSRNKKQLAVTSQSNATQAANATLVAGQNTSIIAKQTTNVVNQTVTTPSKPATAAVEAMKTQRMKRALRRRAAVAQAAVAQAQAEPKQVAAATGSWRSWLSKLR